MGVVLPLCAQKKAVSQKEPLFGKANASYTVTSSELKGACFYLVSGHGGPDPVLSASTRGVSCTKTSMPTTLCSAWGAS